MSFGFIGPQEPLTGDPVGVDGYPGTRVGEGSFIGTMSMIGHTSVKVTFLCGMGAGMVVFFMPMIVRLGYGLVVSVFDIFSDRPYGLLEALKPITDALNLWPVYLQRYWMWLVGTTAYSASLALFCRYSAKEHKYVALPWTQGGKLLLSYDFLLTSVFVPVVIYLCFQANMVGFFLYIAINVWVFSGALFHVIWEDIHRFLLSRFTDMTGDDIAAEAIKENLVLKGYDISGLLIEVNGGIAVISGTVPDSSVLQSVRCLAGAVKGVKRVSLDSVDVIRTVRKR